MSGVWVFDKKGVVRLITNPTRESFEMKPEHPRPGTATATAPGARPRVLVHLPTNQVITSFSQLEQRLNELASAESPESGSLSFRISPISLSQMS
ncbi:hypothetical protein RYX36_007585 [Vicia faba]